MQNENEFNKLMKLACSYNVTVLITGATGTGKTTLAKKIHDKSLRKNLPFISINLATLHDGLLESELFGHEKGAFTGADQKRMGRLELAAGGTLFLDEISELSLKLQAKLLDFIQFKTLTPVGGNQSVQLDVRIIAATHHDLEAAVLRKDFREDLFHRLRMVSIRLPALEERYDELDVLIHRVLSEVTQDAQKPILRFTAEVAERLEAHRWPGNLRELKNVLEFAVLAAEGSEITLNDLPLWMKNGADGRGSAIGLSQIQDATLGVAEVSMSLDYADTLRRFEKEYLIRALSRHRGRISCTANQIGLNKTTLLRRIRAHGINIRGSF